MTISADDVRARLAVVRDRIESVEREYRHDVGIVAVTKAFDDSAVEAAVEAGCRQIGENYAQELLTKADTIERLGPEVHFIGRLQSNKVRQIAHLVTVWETIDRSSVVDEVAKRAPGARVLLQVNATGEESKGGCRPGDVESLLSRAAERGLEVEGLMTVGPTGKPPEAARPAFRIVRELVDQHALTTCSMGMSADLHIAVECGSTEVRVGTMLFGARPG